MRKALRSFGARAAVSAHPFRRALLKKHDAKIGKEQLENKAAWSPRDTAVFYDTSIQTIYRWVREGKIPPPYKPSRNKTLFDPDEQRAARDRMKAAISIGRAAA
jgi:hypothetical protein